jgi:hypothetical protein
MTLEQNLGKTPKLFASPPDIDGLKVTSTGSECSLGVELFSIISLGFA